MTTCLSCDMKIVLSSKSSVIERSSEVDCQSFVNPTFDCVRLATFYCEFDYFRLISAIERLVFGWVQCVYLSANRFPTKWENGIRTCTFVFRLPHATRKTEFEIPFSFSVFLLHWKWNSNLNFRFPFSYYIETGISTVFSFFVFPLLWKTELQLAFPFSNLTFS